MANLIPLSKSSIIKPKKSAIVNADKFLETKPKSSSAIVKADKSSQTLESGNILKEIQKKVIKIDKLLKGSLLLSKKETEKKRVEKEQKDFNKREDELEKKKPKSIPGIKLPSLPKMGFLDWIKNFITQTILGFVFVRLIDHLPKLLKLLPIILKAGEFLIDVGGKLLDGLVTFIDWGYKAYDATRGFSKNVFGESGVKQFDNLMNTLNTLSSVIILASLASAGGGKGGPGGVAGKGGGVGIRGAKDVAGRSRYGTTAEAARRYSQRFGRDAAIKKFGAEGVSSLGGKYARSGATNLARNAFVGLAGKGGAKAILGTIRPFTKRLPIIGGLIDFGLSVALGEDPGRAAFKSIGATLVGALGAAIGSLAFGAGAIIGGILGGIGGDMLGGALYDMFFGGKKPQQPKGKFAKAAGGGKPTTRGGKLVSGSSRRTLSKKKKPRTLSFTPTKIKPGANTGGEDKVQRVFPDPEKPAWWNLFGLFTGKEQPQPQKPKKPKGKSLNPQQFLVGSNDVLGRAKFFVGPTATLVLKTVLGQRPDDLDYKNISKGLNSFIQTTFGGGTPGFAGGGEVDTRQYFSGEDYTEVIAKTVKDSASKEVDTTLRNLSRELSLRPAVGKEEMIQENINRGSGSSSAGAGEEYGEDEHGTPGPAVKTTKGFNAGKGDRSRKIFLHWTASDYRTPFTNYHTTFLGDGTAIRNTKDYGVDKPSPGHTGGANTNSVGLSVAAMNGASENNFGKFPPTSAQVSAMSLEAARLAVAWGWDESTIDKNVMTHAEWEKYATSTGKLPGPPRKWDLDRLRQGDKPHTGGDKLRKMIKSYFRKLKQGTITDSNGTTKVTSTGSPISQMSLETAMEMMQPGSRRGGGISGGNADFWALAAIASLESGNAQGQSDVAQSIYNRVASKLNFGQKSNTIKGHIVAPIQYSPVHESGDPSLWDAITDKESAIKAVESHRNGAGRGKKIVEESAKNIKNTRLQESAKEFVGGRTDFWSTSRGMPPSGHSFIVRHNHRFGYFAGPGSIAYGYKNPKAAGVPSLGASVSSVSSGSVNQKGLPPLPPTGTRRGQNYGDSRGGGRRHAGQDFDAPPNGTFYSRIGGEVVYIDYDPGGYGKYVNIYNKQLNVTERIAEGTKNLVRLGQSISAGTPVQQGTHQTGVFHYEIRKGKATASGFFEGTIDPKKFLSGSRFHGGPILKTGMLFGHKGEYVIDKDSVDLFGMDFMISLNSVENQSQLIQEVPSMIEHLKSISGYTYYENNQETEIVYVKVPEKHFVPVPVGSKGSVFIGSGIHNSVPGMEVLDAIG